MSYHTEKTLSSIRSLVDEWSICREGGKQSFFVLKEIDKLLADTPIDKTVTHNYIDGLNETIGDLRMAASDMLDTIVEDYLAAPESPVVMLKTPSMGTRVVSKNEEAHIIDGDKMKAVRLLVACENDWILHTDSEAAEVRQHKETIDELTETTRKLEGRLSSMYAANSDQDTTINKLHALLADEKMTLAAYRSNPLSDQVADRDNRIEQLIVLNEALRIDIRLYWDRCGRLGRIEKIAEHPAHDCFSTALDDIIKIIQEE